MNTSLFRAIKYAIKMSRDLAVIARDEGVLQQGSAA